jgi:hypothetical protein
MYLKRPKLDLLKHGVFANALFPLPTKNSVNQPISTPTLSDVLNAFGVVIAKQTVSIKNLASRKLSQV